MNLANIEGDEIVIRVPISAIPTAFKIAAEVNEWGQVPDVVDAYEFACDMVNSLNFESNGDTLINNMLDAAAWDAFDNGSRGLDKITIEWYR